MDTKLKNRHKLFVVIWVLFALCLSANLDNMYMTTSEAANDVAAEMVAMAVAAWIFPMFRFFETGNEKIFYAPLELVILVASIAVGTGVFGGLPWLMMREDGTGKMLWGMAVIVAAYWCSGCVRQVYVMGISVYMKERVLLVRYGKQIPGWCSKAIKKAQEGIEKVYRSFDNIDFTDRNNKTILKIVLINALILTVITVLWFYGIVAVVIYSIILFFILRKYFNDLKDKYALLLNATNQMAEGNLNVEVTDDLGVFNPFKKELEKIQDGYQKAVDKEVKSQKMKTELITNMSHDLKTPLTAIITYVDLLKLEKDEEKRKEYIQILEKKSLRLKVLIEDLFEISKATSQTVTLDKMDVDVVNLFKQVKLELDSRFDEAELSFRCTWPEEKLICELDSQKTYRIFENLLVNISKYAMHGTRVYTKVCRENNEAVIQLLNVSAAEITVKAEDLTERFVRGDVSRNTEGSGLGLAIARSFTELQQGTFRLTVEGDMFKVEVGFPLKAVKNVDNSPEFA